MPPVTDAEAGRDAHAASGRHRDQGGAAISDPESAYRHCPACDTGRLALVSTHFTDYGTTSVGDFDCRSCGAHITIRYRARGVAHQADPAHAEQAAASDAYGERLARLHDASRAIREPRTLSTLWE